MIFKKNIDINDLPIKDAKVRRVFIMADGKRTLEQICQFSGLSTDEGHKIILQLEKEGYLSNTDKTTPAKTPQYSAPESDDTGDTVTITPNILEKITSDLAHQVGPIASILIGDKLSAGATLSKKSYDNIVVTLAESIDVHEERNNFLINSRNLV